MKKRIANSTQPYFTEGEICGFNPTEVFKLYAFVDAYEWCDIKQLKSENNLLRVHPELSGLKRCMERITFKKSNSENLERLNISVLHNEIHCIKHGSQLLSFLYHLRNAIAHACVSKQDGMVQFTTFCKNRPTDFSSRGRISLDIVELFTEELKKVKL